MADAPPACQAARTHLGTLRYVETRPGGTAFSFFPLNKLRDYLTEHKVKEILSCGCSQCMEDCRAFQQPHHPLQSLALIIGEDHPNIPRTRSNTAFSLFSLLIYLRHPILIDGFVRSGRFDSSIEEFPEAFMENGLDRYTGSFATRHPVEFNEFTYDFRHWMHQFAARHMDSGHFSSYPSYTILPFINEKEIGRQRDEETGEWTNIGAHGRVISFQIPDEYRNFPNARKIKDFARKTVDRTDYTAFLERTNLEHMQIHNDKHIVTLIKAYSIGGTMNLIFPLAATNLEQLLGDPQYSALLAGSPEIESSDAWIQLLGIANALAKIAGVPTAVSSPRRNREAQWAGFHFDLKPANILIEDDGTWVITDFGQATFTRSLSATPRVAYGGGTDAYAPPEIDNIDEQFSRRYDIWSLGCIFLEVTAFLVLGYAGLKGCAEYSGLNQARQERAAWSTNNADSDSRFFYRAQRGGEFQVKAAIKNFMVFLKDQVADRSAQTREFLAEILQLIHSMLQVDVSKRLDIGEVIRNLKEITDRATSKNNEGEPLQPGPGPSEISIGAPQLGMVKLWHIGQNSHWERASLHVFEDMKGNLRFNSLATLNRTVTNQYMRRDRDEIRPHYAYFDRERAPGSAAWISFANSEASEIPGVLYGFTSPPEAHTVQSLLTYQHIEKSYPLANVQVKKYIKISRKAWTGLTKVLGSKSATLDGIEKALVDGKDLGPANVQLWTEQEDQAAKKRIETQSLSAGSRDDKRKPRGVCSDQQPFNPPRVVIYLQRYGCILIVRANVNWIARCVEGDTRKIHFRPTNSERDPLFVISLLRPYPNESEAGLPLSPQLLATLEEQSQFEADLCELVFTIDADADGFNDTYRQMKRKWLTVRKVMEKQQGYQPGFGSPPHENIGFVTPNKARRISQPTPTREDHAPKPTATEAPSTCLPTDSRLVGNGKQRAEDMPTASTSSVPPTIQINDEPANTHHTSPRSVKPPMLHIRKLSGGAHVVGRGGYGRGRRLPKDLIQSPTTEAQDEEYLTELG